ncbi:MAG: hypothetical protein ACR2I5_08985 [Candidatus Limnocylindria bacterium]
MPVWNWARYAAGLIESLLAQRGARWHLYLGDNASTDDLRGVVDEYPDDRTYQRCERHVRVSGEIQPHHRQRGRAVGALVESGAFRPEIELAADMELIFRLAAYADVLVLDTPLVDYLVHLDSDGNSQWADNMKRRDAEVPLKGRCSPPSTLIRRFVGLRRVTGARPAWGSHDVPQPGRPASAPPRCPRSPRCGERSRPSAAVESIRIREHVDDRQRRRIAHGAIGSAQVGRRDAPPWTILMPAVSAFVAVGGHS